MKILKEHSESFQWPKYLKTWLILKGRRCTRSIWQPWGEQNKRHRHHPELKIVSENLNAAWPLWVPFKLQISWDQTNIAVTEKRKIVTAVWPSILRSSYKQCLSCRPVGSTWTTDCHWCDWPNTNQHRCWSLVLPARLIRHWLILRSHIYFVPTQTSQNKPFPYSWSSASPNRQ